MLAVRTPTHMAWWSLVLFPVSFVAAFVVGEGIPAVLGYAEPSLDTTPWWVIALAVTAAIVVFLLPMLAVAHFSRAATRAGDSNGRAPLIVGLTLVAAFVLLNLASGLLQLLF